MTPVIRIGTRGSKLALWQANFLASSLKEIGCESELRIIKTQGDKIQHLSFDKLEGKGFFTKEIEEALLQDDIDVAVHSMKDLPTTPTHQNLVIAAVSKRANPSDSLLIKLSKVDKDSTFSLPQQAKIGTSSARRKSQMSHFRPDTTFEDIRGNVPTRINKLLEGNLDAIILAAAGLDRLKLVPEGVLRIDLHPKEFIPAPAQGVLAFQVHRENRNLRKLFLQLHNPEVAVCTNVERKTLQMLEGGCQLPLGVYCEKDQSGNFHAWASLGSLNKEETKRLRLSQNTHIGLAEAMVQGFH